MSSFFFIIHIFQLELLILSWVWDRPLGKVNLPGVTPLRRADSPSPSSQQLSTTPPLRDRTGDLSSPDWNVDWLDFVMESCRQPQLPWVHKFSWLSCVKDSVYHRVLSQIWPLQYFCTFFQGGLWALHIGAVCNSGVPLMTKHTTDMLPLHFDANAALLILLLNSLSSDTGIFLRLGQYDPSFCLLEMGVSINKLNQLFWETNR